MIFNWRAHVVPVIFAFSLAVTMGNQPAAAGQLPDDSVYRLDISLVDQDAGSLKLSDLRGAPVLVAMFYTSCPYTCPLTIDALKRVEHALSRDDRARTHVLLVSFDPERDTPKVLKKLAHQRHLDLARWTLARSSAAGVRELAAVLDVQYRALKNGDFIHSSSIILLDGDGRIVARTEGVGEINPSFLAQVRLALASLRGRTESAQ